MSVKPIYIVARMNEDHCHGAAVMLAFVLDLFSLSGRETFTRSDIVVLLDALGKRELPPGLFDQIKDIATEDDA